MFLRDDESYDIVGKGEVMVSLSNGSKLKLRNVKHIPQLKRNLISIGQLADREIKITFDGDVCKITKGAIVMAHDKKEGTFYMTSGFRALILVASSVLDAGVWHQRLEHMSEKGMKLMLSKDKLPELKSIDLNFCEDFIYGKQRKVSFSKVRKTLKAEVGVSSN